MASYSIDNADDCWDGWDDELSIAEDQFLKYFKSRKLSDVTLIVGVDRKRIPGHKFILSQCSWEFFNVFSNIKLDKDELLIEDVTEEVFLCFLKFCYTGKLELDGIDGLAVLKLAYRFKVKHLIEKCETQLLNLVRQNNCLEFHIKSSFLSQDSKLKEKILNEIEFGFVWLTWEKDQKRIFNNFPLEALKGIVDLENLRCDEMEIFNRIMNWAKFNCEKNNISCEPENLRRILGDVFNQIRFPTMKLEWFVEILLKYPKLFTTDEMFDILKDIKSVERSCFKFPHNLRKRGFAYVRDPLTFDWGINGNKIACFPGPFKLRHDSSSEMSIRFMREFSRSLLGFAFISKRNQTKKVISCKLQQEDRSSSNQLDLETEIKKKFVLSWDYAVTIVVFKQQQSLECDKWYNLYCKLDCDMVNIKLDPPYSSVDVNVEGFHIKKGEYNIVPYLIYNI